MDTSLTVSEVLDQIGSDSPTPGGGAVGPLIVAIGCSQVLMAINISLKSFKDKEGKSLICESLAQSRNLIETIQIEALSLWDKDQIAYSNVREAQSISKDDHTRNLKVQISLINATDPGIKTLHLAHSALSEFPTILDLSSKYVASDVACAASQILSGATCAWITILSNVAYIKDEETASSIFKNILLMEKIEKQAKEILAEVLE